MKTITYIFLLLIILIFITASTCKKEKTDGLVTVNNANHTINVTIEFDYPDTTLQKGRECLDCIADIDANTSFKHFYFPNGRYNWSIKIADRNIHNTLTVFVIHKDTLDKYTFEQIQKDYNILKRYELTVDELEAQNWTITYP